MRGLAALVAIAGCASEPAALPSGPHALPAWDPVPLAGIDVARPTAYVADGRPTLLLFTAPWCPSCYASLYTEAALAQTFGEAFQVGIGLVETTDEDFVASAMARQLAAVPVWTYRSVHDLAVRCNAQTLPLACLVDRGRVVYRGPAITAREVLTAYRKPPRVAETAARTAVYALLGSGVPAPEIPGLIEATRGDPGWQIALAQQLAANTDATPADVTLAVELAHAVTTVDGGLDYAHLDTYALALSKANFAEEAATVGWRVLHLCRATGAACVIEKIRASACIYYARHHLHH